jgi:Helix-turn-helix.
MVKSTASSRALVDARGSAYARLASRVLEALNEAVTYRKDKDGVTLAMVADRIGCHRSQLSRTLNGTAKNLTLKTISDILWATDFDPEDFHADPVELICPNGHDGFNEWDSKNTISFYVKSESQSWILEDIDNNLSVEPHYEITLK